MVVFVCLHVTLLHYHHHADLSEYFQLLKCLSCIFCLECLSKIKLILSLSFMKYMGLYVFSLSILLVMIVRIHVRYLVIIIISEVWPICHCLWLGYKTKLCAVCLFIFLSCERSFHNNQHLCGNAAKKSVPISYMLRPSGAPFTNMI